MIKENVLYKSLYDKVYVANYYLLPTIKEDESWRKVYMKVCLGDCTFNMLISEQSSRD